MINKTGTIGLKSNSKELLIRTIIIKKGCAAFISPTVEIEI